MTDFFRADALFRTNLLGDSAGPQILDQDAAEETTVGLSEVIFTPPAGCQKIALLSDVDIAVTTNGDEVVAEDATLVVYANVLTEVPVRGGIAVKAASMKVKSGVGVGRGASGLGCDATVSTP